MTPLPLAACLLIVILGGLPILARADATVWFENSTTKVFRDDPPGETKVARLTSAANEVESVQIVVRAHEGPLRNVMVRVSDLVRDKGARIPADAVELFRVAYVHLPAHSRDFPDALPPWTGCDIAAGENQPVWADIHIPADTPPGAYRATVTVQADGVPAEALALELTVWSFALPETPRSRSAFGLHGQPVAQQHGVEVGSPAYDSLMDKYRELLVAHRAMPTSPGRPLESDETARYLDDPRVCAFSLPYSDDDAMLKRQAAYVRAKGWIDKAFFYVVDEPWNKGHYDLLRERAAKIHAADPDLKIVTPYFREPDFAADGGVHGLLTGICGIWCPKVSFYRESFLTQRQELGEEVWWYVCWEPGAPYANLYVDMAGIDHRALFWQQAHYGVEGFLYWSTTWWQPTTGTADPWTDMATVKDLSPTVYGDGSLLYPGSKVGVDGPVASIRLKLIREGLEDVEYLRLLEDREGRAGVRTVTGQVVQGLDAYSKDVDQYLALREAVGRRLSAAAQ